MSGGSERRCSKPAARLLQECQFIWCAGAAETCVAVRIAAKAQDDFGMATDKTEIAGFAQRFIQTRRFLLYGLLSSPAFRQAVMA